MIEVELILDSLSSGETSRGVCPKCKGGSSGEKSFLCSRDNGGIGHYICFRASCGYRGKAFVGGGATHEEQRPRGRKLHRFTRELEPLKPGHIAYWRYKFDINPDNSVYWCPSLERFALRVYGPHGEHRGWVLRDFGGDLSPKVLAYPERAEEPFIGWMQNKDKTDALIVVEDLVSARKVADAGYTGVSLNGTTMNYEIAYEIREQVDHFILSLDAGTMQTMLNYRDRFDPLFDGIEIWSLDKDLKYVPRTRIIEGVESGRSNFRE